MESLDYSTWSSGVKRRIAHRRVPLGGTIELTRRCNNRCRHCYNNLPAHDPAALAAELGAAEITRILDEMAAAGCIWVLFTGGEILLRPDFRDIYTHAREKGLLITLFTNATRVTAELADFLARHRPFSIEVTLYGCTRETYESVTGTPGSFDRCLRGIGHLRERGLPLKLKSTLMTLNRHELRGMRRFAEEDLGLAFRFDALLNPRCDCSRSPLEVRLSPEEIVALDLEDPQRSAALREFAGNPSFRNPSGDSGDSLYLCGGGAHSFAVDPYGRLRACALSTGPGFDLRSAPFRDGWDHFLLAERGRKMDPLVKCRTCCLHPLCGMCPAHGELECGDPRRPVDFLCRVAHLRAYALGLTLRPHGDCEYCPSGGSHPEMMLAVERLKTC